MTFYPLYFFQLLNNLFPIVLVTFIYENSSTKSAHLIEFRDQKCILSYIVYVYNQHGKQFFILYYYYCFCLMLNCLFLLV